MIVLMRDVTDPHGGLLLKFKAFTPPTADGTVALQMPDGTYAYQVPAQYGQFAFDPSPDGAYQRAKVCGQLVSFWTRPQDPAFTYTWAELPN